MTRGAAQAKPSTVIPPIVLAADTSPQQALEMAYLCARALNERRARDMSFVHELSERVNIPCAGSALVRFLRVGFAAGYFGKELPALERVSAYRRPLKSPREPSGMPRLAGRTA